MLSLNTLPWYKRIQLLRAAKGWSQDEAADKCGTNQKVYWLWEKGKSFPRRNSQIAIARAFDVEVGEIFGEATQKGGVKNGACIHG